MRLRNQIVETTVERIPPDGSGTDTQSELRERAAALVAAADEVIARTLSRDSAVFLAQNRQMGGQ